jgi:hypothetical protein
MHRVGKWRVKQVFVADRKTCLLSHNRRQADQSQAEFTVHRVSELIASGMAQEVAAQCGRLFQNAIISGLGVPEVNVLLFG